MKERLTKSQQVCDLLSAAIAQGQFRAGSYLPTESSLCAHHGMSKKTIRAALRHLGELGLVAPRHGQGWQVVHSAKGHAKPVSILVPEQARHYADFIAEAKSILAGAGIPSTLHLWQRNYREWYPPADIYQPEQTSGLLYLSGTGIPPEHLEVACRHHLPVVCAFCQAEKPYDTVATDNRRMAEALALRLAGLGHRRLFFVNLGLHQDASFRHYHEGFADAGPRHGLALHEVEATDNWLPDAAWRTLVGELRAWEPDAVVAATDVLGRILHRLLTQAGVRIPNDLSLGAMGFEATREELAALGIGSLCVARHPAAAIGRLAAERLVARLAGNASPARLHLLPPAMAEADTLAQRNTAKKHPGRTPCKPIVSQGQARLVLAH